jgi:hypothetical protein
MKIQIRHKIHQIKNSKRIKVHLLIKIIDISSLWNHLKMYQESIIIITYNIN